MTPLALVVLLAVSAAAEPERHVCTPWFGTARTWSTYDFESRQIRPMTLRECPGTPKAALAYAKSCMAKFGDRLVNKSHVIIGDFTTNANFVRLYVLKWDQNDPENSTPMLRGGMVGGAGNKPSSGETGAATAVSDTWDSAATPGGCMRMFGTGDRQTLQSVAENLQAYRLDGLEEQNACAYTRGIFLHESYISKSGPSKGFNRVRTRRVEDLHARNAGSMDFGNIPYDKYLGTSVSPGCVTISEDDFKWLKESGIVPHPGDKWKPTNPARAKEGVLFVAWFWDEKTVPAQQPRSYAKALRCDVPVKRGESIAVPAVDMYEKALIELNERLPRQ